MTAKECPRDRGQALTLEAGWAVHTGMGFIQDGGRFWAERKVESCVRAIGD